MSACRRGVGRRQTNWRPAGYLSTLLAFSGAMALAGGGQAVDISDFRALPGLDLEGITITDDGTAVLGPRQRVLVGPSLPVLWDVIAVRHPEAGAYAAGGEPGSLVWLPLSGAGRVVYTSAAASITALEILPGDRLLLGESPGGRLLSVGVTGDARMLASTASRYIWDLQADGRGGIWVATGGPGALLRLDTVTGKIEHHLELGQEQVRSLAGDGEGGVYLGSSGSGWVQHYRPGSRRKMLLDSDAVEVAALQLTERGVVAALVHASPALEQMLPGGRPTLPAVPAQASPVALPAGPAAILGQVVRISASGDVEILWESARELPLSLLAQPGGTVLMGSLPGGGLLQLLGHRRFNLMAALPGNAVTALRDAGDGSLLAATGGLGSVVHLQASGSQEGVLLAPVHEAGSGSLFGDLRWWWRGSPAGSVEVSARSGNTVQADRTWSPWGRWHGGGELAAPAAPPGRYFQWRARLRTSGGESPQLLRVRATYLPPNHPPRLLRAEVLPPGTVLESLPPSGGRLVAPARPEAAAVGPVPTRQSFEEGRRTLTWEAEDDDGDALTATLLARADGESEFYPLAQDIAGRFHVFDESALGDGGFVMRVEVTDGSANTQERTRTAVLETARFEIDTTPPRLEDLRWKAAGSVLSFTASDAVSWPRGAEVAVDGGPWRSVLPADGLEDGREERYEVSLGELAPGSHALVVRVRDGGGRAAASRLRINAGP